MSYFHSNVSCDPLFECGTLWFPMIVNICPQEGYAQILAGEILTSGIVLRARWAEELVAAIFGHRETQGLKHQLWAGCRDGCTHTGQEPQVSNPGIFLCDLILSQKLTWKIWEAGTEPRHSLLGTGMSTQSCSLGKDRKGKPGTQF